MLYIVVLVRVSFVFFFFFFFFFVFRRKTFAHIFLGFNDHGKENIFPRGSFNAHSITERHAQRTRYNAIHNRPKSLLRRVRAHFDESVDETTGARFVSFRRRLLIAFFYCSRITDYVVRDGLLV